MTTAKCVQCGAVFEFRRRGRPREYCSLRCRRVMELRRRVWDARFTELEDARLHRGPLTHWTFLMPQQAAALLLTLLAENPRP